MKKTACPPKIRQILKQYYILFLNFAPENDQSWRNGFFNYKFSQNKFDKSPKIAKKRQEHKNKNC